MAAAISLKAKKDEHYVLELLELSCCVIAGLLLEMCTDILNFKEQYPGLVVEFKSLWNELNSFFSGTVLLGNTAYS